MTDTELIAMAKREPGKLNYGSGGNGSTGHLITESFLLQAGNYRSVTAVAATSLKAAKWADCRCAACASSRS